MSDAIAVGEGTKVTLHFALALDNGDEIDSNFDGQAPCFQFGDGSLLPGFEEALVGLMAGEEKECVIPPEKAFGQPNPSNIQHVSRTSFTGDMELKPGLVVSFSDPAGGELPGVIKTIGDSEVEVDFNHPLAGRSIHFRVRIIDVEPSVKH